MYDEAQEDKILDYEIVLSVLFSPVSEIIEYKENIMQFSSAVDTKRWIH